MNPEYSFSFFISMFYLLQNVGDCCKQNQFLQNKLKNRDGDKTEKQRWRTLIFRCFCWRKSRKQSEAENDSKFEKLNVALPTLGRAARLGSSAPPLCWIFGGWRSGAVGTWNRATNGCWNVGCGRLGCYHFPYKSKGFPHSECISPTHLFIFFLRSPPSHFPNFHFSLSLSSLF